MMFIVMTEIGDDFDPWTKHRAGDFRTIGCSYSTLLFSEGNITGVIDSDNNTITVPWKDFQALLNDGSKNKSDN
jgi:hypothetical protein